jgi:hypothetical protein
MMEDKNYTFTDMAFAVVYTSAFFVLLMDILYWRPN